MVDTIVDARGVQDERDVCLTLSIGFDWLRVRVSYIRPGRENHSNVQPWSTGLGFGLAILVPRTATLNDSAIYSALFFRWDVFRHFI